jgi:hypothetical protein
MAALRKVFADANVLIAGADSRTGASNAVLLMAEIGLYRLLVSRLVLAAQSSLQIMSPSEFIQEIRSIM